MTWQGAEKLLFDVPSYKFGVRRQRRRFGFLSIFVVIESKAASRYACRRTPN